MTQPFAASDIFLSRSVGGIHCAYEQNLAACSLTAVSQPQDRSTSALWIYPLNGDAPWQMTTAGNENKHPRWSPDGRQLGFISDRSGTPQVFVIDSDGGEARLLSQLDGMATAFEWTADGKAVLVSVSLRVDPSLRGARAALDAAPPPEGAAQIIWRLNYKADGLGYTLDQEIHLFWVDVASGLASQLTDGPFNVQSAVCSPDGRRILHTRSREGDEAHRTDLWLMDIDGANARQLTTEHAQALFPVCSPDGQWVVFSGTLAEGDALVRLWTVALESGNVQSLGDASLEIAGEGNSVQFVGGDSARVLAIIAHRGVQAVAAITLAQGELQWLVQGERQLSQLACSRDFMAYTAESPIAALEIYRCRADASEEKCLSRLNAWWQERPQATLERRQFEVPDGHGGSESIDGWLIRPQGGKEAPGATPLLVDVHGGPASYVLFAYGPSAYWSMLWSQGWSILALNPVGSASYGREFCERLRGHWGELDLPQQLAAVKALQDQGLASQQVAIAGKSYGGFMSCWAVGHSDVFQAAVPMAALSQLDAHWGSSDSGYYSDCYALQGEDGAARERMRAHSPVEFLQGATTPTLLLHGEKDERCPRGQAEAAFVALRRGGNPDCELVLYPGEGHKFTSEGKPSYRVDAMQRLVDWVARWHR